MRSWLWCARVLKPGLSPRAAPPRPKNFLAEALLGTRSRWRQCTTRAAAAPHRAWGPWTGTAGSSGGDHDGAC